MKFNIGQKVRKIKGSEWSGTVVGTYSTKLTPEGYAVESSTEHGSVQIYPSSALEACIEPVKYDIKAIVFWLSVLSLSVAFYAWLLI